jgi:hypothetical protein
MVAPLMKQTPKRFGSRSTVSQVPAMTSSEAFQRCHRGPIPFFTFDGQVITPTQALSVQY